MLLPDLTFEAVAYASGICKRKMLSRSRLWPIVEARMLFIMLACRNGATDQSMAWLLNRSRTTVLKARRNAESYIKISKTFNEKYLKAFAYYEKKKPV